MLSINTPTPIYSQFMILNRMELPIQSIGVYGNIEHLESIREICQEAVSESSQILLCDFYLRYSSEVRLSDDDPIELFIDLFMHEYYKNLLDLHGDSTAFHSQKVFVICQDNPQNSNHSVCRFNLIVSGDDYLEICCADFPDEMIKQLVNLAWIEALDYRGEEARELSNFPDNGVEMFSADIFGAEYLFNSIFYRVSSMSNAKQGFLNCEIRCLPDRVYEA